jgi:hypothetical protein
MEILKRIAYALGLVGSYKLSLPLFDRVHTPGESVDGIGEPLDQGRIATVLCLCALLLRSISPVFRLHGRVRDSVHIQHRISACARGRQLL